MYCDTHCYGCGKELSEETIRLRAEKEHSGETPELVDALNAASACHEECFS
jgi:hypothetical protein